MDLGGIVEVSTSEGLPATADFWTEDEHFGAGERMFSVLLEPGTEHIGLQTLAEEPGSQLFTKCFRDLLHLLGYL